MTESGSEWLGWVLLVLSGLTAVAAAVVLFCGVMALREAVRGLWKTRKSNTPLSE